jgi:zinc-binding alcohol dehydrogenase family protein
MKTTMKAVAFRDNLPVEHEDCLVDVELPMPVTQPHDLLVRVEAVSVNPVDTKIRRSGALLAGQPWRVPGWDGAGVVEAVGAAVTRFRPGDRVWYAGDLTRQGSNAQYQGVDARLAGRMPSSLGFAQAAALPLTAITAWELLFDRLQLRGASGSLLVVGAAGGVGSILLQLARELTSLTLVATASRPQTAAWVRELGAHHVINHSQPLARALRDAGIESVSHAVSLNHTDQHFVQLVEVLAPQGRLALIDDPAGPLDVLALKRKSLSLHWELMFTRSLYQTEDMAQQGALLDQVADMVDAGRIRSTVDAHFGAINAANLRRAHAMLESGKARGKIVLEGF